jgi:hypothetical protein
MAQVPIKITFFRQCETLERVLKEARDRDPYDIQIYMEKEDGKYPTVVVAETFAKGLNPSKKTRIRISGETEKA